MLAPQSGRLPLFKRVDSSRYHCLGRMKKAKVHEGMNREPAHTISKRGRLGEGRPTKRTPQVAAKIAEAVAIGLTDEEAALLAGVNPDTMTE